MNPNERGQGVGIRYLSGPILVPMDGTEVSEGILPWVARIAGQADARLILLTAVDPDGIEYPPVGPTGPAGLGHVQEPGRGELADPRPRTPCRPWSNG